jgi:hypothetical protein
MEIDRIEQTFLEMTRSRVYGILAGYEDCNDHDALRSDPVFKLIAGRLPTDDDLASQPTLSRFENAIGPPSLFRLEDLLIEQFVESLDGPAGEPLRVTLDLDVFDDPTHGQQQLTFFHGFYEQYQYLPRVMTCADNDLVVMAALLPGTMHAATGVDDDLHKLVPRLRERFPHVRIVLRCDSGFATPRMYESCERLGVDYTIGLGLNATLKNLSDDCLQQAVQQFEQSGEPQRLFVAFEYQAQSWPAPRWVVIKCEANSQGTNRRAVVTNRPGARVVPAAAYDEYADRGESENRNKELKRGLRADRLSCHRFMANFFRLYLHVFAANLLVQLRHAIAAPPEPERPSDAAEARLLDQPEPAALPASQLAGSERKRYFNQRRKADPLGEGHPDTWRRLLFKVAAEVIVTARRVLVRLSGSWPYENFYRDVCAKLSARFGANTS